MKKLLTLLCLLLFSLNSFSQEFHQGTVNYLNGDIKKGLIKLKSDFLKFKNNDYAKTSEIDCNLLKSVMFESVNGDKYTIERTNRQLGSSSRFRYGWLQLLQEGGYYNLYVSGDGYSFDKSGRLILTSSYVTNRTLPSFTYYIKKFDKEKTMYFCETSGLGTEHFFRKSCLKYLSDNSELLAKIEKKELTKMDVQYVIDLYNKFKKKKS